MLKFSNLYHPLTARPFLSGQSYREYLPCRQLRPYIACYWTTNEEQSLEDGKEQEAFIIPDTCMDIIVNVNHTKQKITGVLCGIQDEPMTSVQKQSSDFVTCFAIRFPFWAAHLFIHLNFKEIRNRYGTLEVLDEEWQGLFIPFLSIIDIQERIAWVETFLLEKLSGIQCNPHLFNSIGQILTSSGSASVKEVCSYSCVSQRQLERVFLRDVGLPLKRIASLVRYQNVWRDMILSYTFDIQDAVYRYGYADQAHLLNEFRRFHGTSPKEAVHIAQKNR